MKGLGDFLNNLQQTQKFINGCLKKLITMKNYSNSRVSFLCLTAATWDMRFKGWRYQFRNLNGNLLAQVTWQSTFVANPWSISEKATWMRHQINYVPAFYKKVSLQRTLSGFVSNVT